MTEIITAAQFKAKKKSKYKAKKVEYNGIKFDSIKERDRYVKLLLLKQSGELTEIELQPRFDINVNGKFCGFYKADFRVTWKSGSVTIEDVKGMRLPVYILKKKLVEAIYNIVIIEK